jgi:hypothetical protein
MFPDGTTHPIRFLLTPLAHSTSAVLGYSWLLQQNPSIDWATHEITFRMKTSTSPVAAPRATTPGAHSQLSEHITLPAPLTDISGPSPELQAAAAKVTISFVRASALGLLRRLPPSHPQSVICSGIIEHPSCSARLAVPTPDSSEIDPTLAAEYEELRPLIPEEYHVYLDVFSKRKGTTLPPRRPHDHKIDLEDSTSPPFGPIYSLSEIEQLAL